MAANLLLPKVLVALQPSVFYPTWDYVQHEFCLLISVSRVKAIPTDV